MFFQKCALTFFFKNCAFTFDGDKLDSGVVPSLTFLRLVRYNLSPPSHTNLRRTWPPKAQMPKGRWLWYRKGHASDDVFSNECSFTFFHSVQLLLNLRFLKILVDEVVCKHFVATPLLTKIKNWREVFRSGEITFQKVGKLLSKVGNLLSEIVFRILLVKVGCKHLLQHLCWQK